MKEEVTYVKLSYELEMKLKLCQNNEIKETIYCKLAL